MSSTPAPPGAPSYAPEPRSIGVRWETTDHAEIPFVVNRTQLRAEACVLCARMNGELEDAGHAYVDGLGWRVKVCTGGCLTVAA